MESQRPVMGRDGGLWLEQSMVICTGSLQRILRARPGDMQTQGRASKPYWPRGVHGDMVLQTFQDHLRAVLLELFLRRTEEEGNHDEKPATVGPVKAGSSHHRARSSNARREARCVGSLREKVPRSSHAGWSPAPHRPDPLSLLGEQ